MKRITVSSLTKSFPDEVAVDHVTLEVNPGEFFVIVGPTGCGKTTFLKLVAGLIKQDEGNIYFDGENVNDISPARRRVRMIFENNALYPHLKVHDDRGYSNLNFPLKIQKYGVGLIKKKVMEVVHRLGIPAKLFNRKPGELSEGQKQQVALGRALTIPPEVILFDEPLRDLDPQTREESRKEVMRAHRDYDATSLYVTHDLAEGFSLGDRVAIMKEGKFAQVGTPEEILQEPATAFVRSFTESYQSVYREAFLE
ncbi:MAG: ABC transporter ATP-binding protein [Candidatus Acetothermia bacterium]